MDESRGVPIKVGLGPQAIAITPDGKTVYAVTPYQTIPISTATGKPGKPIKSAGGHAIASAQTAGPPSS